MSAVDKEQEQGTGHGRSSKHQPASIGSSGQAGEKRNSRQIRSTKTEAQDVCRLGGLPFWFAVNKFLVQHFEFRHQDFGFPSDFDIRI
jgi:hypothetical protein